MKYRWITLFVFISLASMTQFALAYEIDFYTYNPDFTSGYYIMYSGAPVGQGILVQVIRPGSDGILHPPTSTGAPSGTNVEATRIAIGDGTQEDGTWATVLNGHVGSATGDQLQAGTNMYFRVWSNIAYDASYPFPSGSHYCDGGPYVVPDSVHGICNPPTSLGLHDIQVIPTSASPNWMLRPDLGDLPALRVTIGGNLPPDPVNYGLVSLGNYYDVTFHLANNGTAPLHVTNLASTGDYAVQGNTSYTILPTNSQDVVVRFTPTATGTRTGIFSVTHDAVGSPTTFNVTGTGTGTPFLLTTIGGNAPPNPVDYGTVQLGNDSDITFHLSNVGTASILIANMSTSGDFAVLGNTGYNITPGNSQDVTVRFTPNITGIRVGTFSFSHNAQGSPATFNLTGNAYGIPRAPENLSITTDGNDAILTWSKVDSTVNGFPIIVDGYLLYERASAESPWVLLSSIANRNDTTYTDAHALLSQPIMFYRVTAWSGSYSSDRAQRAIPRDTPEAEVHKIIRWGVSQ